MTEIRKRKISNASAEFQLDPSTKQKVLNLFEKKFIYNSSPEIEIIFPKNLTELNDVQGHWEVRELMTLKNNLNTLKNKLSDKDIVKWHRHTNYMNPAGNVVGDVRQFIRPELCTQAWCKFYEIVSSFDLVDLQSTIFSSVHLCEAPGAFITSLNHYLVSTGYSGDWSWLGTTLNPYYEGNSPSHMIDDDRFVRGSYGNWDFGVDNTGNLMSWQNIQQLRRKAREIGPVHLVTADGSIDCQDNPAEQEGVVSKLHYCEALTSVLILSPGGSLVLKKFTMFESESICLVYLINCLFKKVTVFKPATSKSGNSEVYWVCQGFKGLGDTEKYIELLCQKYCDSIKEDGCIFSKDDIPSEFMNQHIQCCQTFTTYQTETIQRNLDCYGNMTDEDLDMMDAMKEFCTDLFFTKYNVKSIPSYCKITQNQKQQNRQTSNNRYKELKRNEGTYNDRVKTQGLQWEQKVLQYPTYEVNQSQIRWFQNNHAVTEAEVTDWACATGSAVKQINSSRFCDEKLVHQFNCIRDHMEDEQIQCQKTNAISAALDLLFDQSVYDFPCHVMFVSANEKEVKEIEGHEYVNQVSKVTDDNPLTTGSNVILVLPDFYQQVHETCTDSQCNLLQQLINTIKILCNDTIMLIPMTTCLTRFTAGIIYVLGTCFRKIGFLPLPGGKSSQQIMICYKYTGLASFLLEHCCLLLSHFKDSNSGFIMLETVPVLKLTEDQSFVNYLTASNETLLKSYISTVVREIKQRLPDQT